VGSAKTGCFHNQSPIIFEYRILTVSYLPVRTFFVLPQKRYPRKVKAAQQFNDSAAQKNLKKGFLAKLASLKQLLFLSEKWPVFFLAPSEFL
jgi:hypothetical protein